MSEISKISLKPSGVSYRNKYKMELGSNSSLCSEPGDVWSKNASNHTITQERCSQLNCKKVATLRCTDCVEVYCENCCTTLHKAARGLQTHKITKISEDSALELIEKCSFHPDQILEFCCSTCSTVVCAYCVLQSHQSHTYSQLTYLKDSEQTEFETLIENAEMKLKRLILAHKKVTTELERNTGSNQTSSIYSSFSQYFANIHARLQILETSLRNDITKAKNINSSTLNEIGNELLLNIRNLNRFINIAKNIKQPSSPSGPKLNVKVLTERLQNSLNLPCYVIGQQQQSENIGFLFKDIFSNIEENFSISVDYNDEGYRLVGEDEMPQDYDANMPSELLSLDMSECNLEETLEKSSSVSSQKSSKELSPTEILTNALLPRKRNNSANSNTLETWVKSAADVMESSGGDNYFLENEAREYVIVTHIDSPELFYVQLVRFQNKLNALSKQIEQYIRGFAPMVKTVELNKLYIVKYKYDRRDSDPEWCRGRIVDIILNEREEQTYKVHFIDYGNSKIINNSNVLREISCGLAKPKPYALQCKLFNLYPVNNDWDVKATKLMARILSGTQSLMVVMNNSDGITEVDLMICHNYMSSIREALIFIGYAAPNIDVITPSSNLKMKSSVPKLHAKTLNFKKEQSLEIVLSHIIDPENIYMQESSCLHHIEQLSNSMGKYYSKHFKNRHSSSNKREQIYVPKKDMVVALCYEHRSSWYRGRVCNVITGQGLVEVFLVDYGKTVTISYKDIRALSEKFRTLDSQAVLISLTDIKPMDEQTSWSQDAVDYLKKYVDSKEKLRAVIVEPENPPQVALFECYASMDVCINALLVQQDLAISTGEISTNLQWLKNRDSSCEKEEPSFVVDLLNTIQCSKQEDKDENEDSDDEEKENLNKLRKEVRIVKAISPDLIYVAWNDEAARKEQHQLQCALHDHYSVQHAQTSPPKDGEACVIHNNKDKQYYRAIILNKIDDLNFRVMLRDIAEEIIVSKGNIYPLEVQFKQFRDGAIRCHLSGILPAGDSSKWSGLSIEFLQELFKKKLNILMTKDGPIDTKRKSVPVAMWYSEFKPGEALKPSKCTLHNINKLLIKQGLALKQRPPSEILDTSGSSNTKDSDETSSDTITDKSQVQLQPTSELEKTTDQQVTPKKKLHETSGEQTASVRIPKVVHKAPENLLKLFLSPQMAEKSSSLKHSSNSESLEEDHKKTETCSNDTMIPDTINESKKTDWQQIIDEEELREFSNSLLSISSRVTEMVDWLPPRPFNDTTFYALATFVDDDANIYLHDVSLEPVLKHMEESMKRVFDRFTPEPAETVWMPGQPCTVKYFINDSWYRGKILSVSNDLIKVFMIDYGNEEDCKPEDLCRNVMYTDLPAFANKVQLYKVYPKKDSKWLTSDLDELHKKVVENKVFVTLKGTIKDHNVPLAVLKLDDVNINQYMLKTSKNLVSSQPKKHESSGSDSDDVIVEAEISSDVEELAVTKSHLTEKSSSLPSTSTTVTSPRYYHNALPEDLIGEKMQIVIVSLRNYNEFVFEIPADENMINTKELFESISEEIKQTALKQPQLDNLEVGTACICKFSEDEEWYRGEVYDIDSKSGNIGIWFVDFGNFEYVPRSDIRELNPNWLKLPVLQYRGQIDNIELSDEPCLLAVFENMSKYCGTLKTAKIVSVNPVRIHLYNDNDELAYQDLLNEGLLISKE
ncbi:hypothetical protein ILUMI_23400 [Ignelater luminosus]|uniref:Tudor domain-containing protein 1 n=1 Tax=Ignelater luminosus TaxID=2038154 RepID=A0A8K0CCJ0_IGNLU|nr:hypothetical protein ILUMI_23400 [Ignelater luminosus]